MSKINEAFRIYVDQLTDGQVESINEEFSPEFLDIKESDLHFNDKVNMKGSAYLANDTLVLQFSANTRATIPCLICNSSVSVELKLKNVYHIEPLDQIKSGIFCFEDVLREAILLEVPAYAECNSGKCSHRKDIDKYLKNLGDENSPEEGHRPFAHL